MIVEQRQSRDESLHNLSVETFQHQMTPLRSTLKQGIEFMKISAHVMSKGLQIDNSALHEATEEDSYQMPQPIINANQLKTTKRVVDRKI